jgi:hypothetical protein
VVVGELVSFVHRVLQRGESALHDARCRAEVAACRRMLPNIPRIKTA